MTGSVQAAIGVVPSFQGKAYTVTTGAIGGGVFGYTVTGPVGAISPSTFGGLTIRECWSQNITTTTALRIQLSGITTQNAFSKITVQCDDGSWRPLLSSDANFSASGGVTTWMWGVGGSPASFAAWTSAGNTRLFFII